MLFYIKYFENQLTTTQNQFLQLLTFVPIGDIFFLSRCPSGEQGVKILPFIKERLGMILEPR